MIIFRRFFQELKVRILADNFCFNNHTSFCQGSIIENDIQLYFLSEISKYELTFTCSKSGIETLEKDAKYVQS